jgi:inorganic phosphate transporter, PiT family
MVHHPAVIRRFLKMPHFWETMNFNTVNYLALPGTVLLLMALAFAFDFLNGVHDSANSIATVVSTRVLSPYQAVLWAAFFNFIAFAIFHLKVAGTIGKDIVEPGLVDNRIIAATLLSACAWNILTWYLGLPTSSSHALTFSLVGAGLASAGFVALRWNGLSKTIVFIILSPLIGAAVAAVIFVIVMWSFRKFTPRKVEYVFRRGQLLSAALYSLGHGGNDAQKTMGIIFLLLIAASQGGSAFPTPQEVPTEIVLGCHLAMGMGTLLGGWRIVKTMGQRVIKLRPVDGFCAETGAAVTLAMTVFGGIPVSTTHTITGALVGVGSLKRVRAVRWIVAKAILWAWILTIPGTMLMAAICWYLLGLFA